MHNVGSIFRTADAAGIEKIYLCGITPAPIDKFGRKRRQITKVSLGAENYIPWEHAKSTTRLIDKFKKQGYTVLAIEQSKKSIPYHARASYRRATRGGTTPVEYLALVFGNELKGLPSSILNHADYILEIPMKGKKESLNVAVTFGIVVFHLAYHANYTK